MSKLMPSRVIAAVVMFAAGLVAMAGAAALSADDKPLSAAAPAAQSTGGRFFEMRTYHAAPGKLDALHARFREHTLSLFDKHGIESVAYWVHAPAEGKPADTLTFVLAYKDRAAREAAWKAFAEDPAWVKAKTESEANGPLVQKVDQVFMTPAEYSPLK